MSAGREFEWERWGAPGSVRWVVFGEGAAAGEPAAPEACAPAGEDALRLAAEALDRGDVLVHPTSTVYGLGGRPRAEVSARIARLKRRAGTPLIRLAGDRDALLDALPGLRWTEAAERLAGSFWPGPLTLVLDDGSESGVAVRVDSHPVTRALLQRAGGLMTSTSLNVTGRPAARTREGALRSIEALGPEGHGLGWLDAGDLPISEASTIYSLREGRRGVLREGAVSAARIAEALEACGRTTAGRAQGSYAVQPRRDEDP